MKKENKNLLLRGRVCPKWAKSLVWALVIALATPLAASAQNQKVTINVSGVDVKVVFRIIKEQTGLTYMYKEEDLKEITPVSLGVRDETVEAAMTKLLAGTPLEFKIENGTIIVSRKKAAAEQERVTYSGVVKDMHGKAIPGVMVLLKGTMSGTATDVNGRFRFTVAKHRNPVLVFTAIGIKRLEYPVKDDKPIDVILEESHTELDEVKVVSTGYYDVDKRLSTSAITSLKAEDIVVPGISTIDQMLEGRVPGMTYMQNSGQVGATPKLKIRGTTTLLGSTQPLWVVDGVILSDPVNVDPASINDLDFVNLLGNANYPRLRLN